MNVDSTLHTTAARFTMRLSGEAEQEKETVGEGATSGCSPVSASLLKQPWTPNSSLDATWPKLIAVIWGTQQVVVR